MAAIVSSTIFSVIPVVMEIKKCIYLFCIGCVGNDWTDGIYNVDLGACYRLSGLQRMEI